MRAAPAWSLAMASASFMMPPTPMTGMAPSRAEQRRAMTSVERVERGAPLRPPAWREVGECSTDCLDRVVLVAMTPSSFSVAKRRARLSM